MKQLRLHESPYLRQIVLYLIGGAGGALITIVGTWVLTRYVYGVEHYFSAYVLSLGTSILFNFLFHTTQTFKTKRQHTRRFIIFIVYSIALAVLQALIVRTITHIVGKTYYIFVIAGTITVLSLITFTLYRKWLFNDATQLKL